MTLMRAGRYLTRPTRSRQEARFMSQGSLDWVRLGPTVVAPRFSGSSVRFAVAAAGLLALAAAMALAAAPVQAASVHCGQRITRDLTLKRDLTGCPNNGLVVAADGITIDLNGHRVDGDGAEFEDCQEGAPCDIGIANRRHDRVTIRHGSVRDFSYG